uniref:Uncharacterized protein n=1 Tax=Euplotes crassus TaxID=5936 RepID=A0A7S3KSN0_EUPCR|mmetsp:Transcript_39645/g.39229  ORF Transcript_39645/g.39229 Transcript_39645/m.39229 type:complete len:444 (+) Transcript_39645:318-1649(+)
MKSSFDKALEKREFKQTSQRTVLTNTKSNNPGPGNYSPSNKASKLSAPKYGFGSEKKMRQPSKFNGPSPNLYEVKDTITRRSFQKTGMGYGKKVDPAQVLVDTPGPGSYKEPSYIQEGKKFSMGAKDLDKRKDRSSESPGPNVYNPDVNKVRDKAPQFGFGTEKKLVQKGKNHSPDPASYNVNDKILRKTAQASGMGYGGKINLSKTLADTPGPGSYDMRSTVTDGKKIGMGAKLSNNKNGKNNSPGPGAYSPSRKVSEKAEPKFGFGTSSRLQEAGKNSVPSPNSYQVKDDIMRKTAQSSGMGFGGKIDFVKNSQGTPGPGAYEYQTHIVEGKKYGMGIRLNSSKGRKEASPGPGAYKSEVVDLKRKHKSYSLGKQTRFDRNLKKSDLPGPGLYGAKGQLGGPKFGFGSEQREKKKAAENPGPGFYEIDRSFNNIKAYERAG